MIKAITLDIDGTITNENRQLDVKAIEPIRKAEATGIKICLATGNVLCFARTASVLLGTSGPLIAEDGGIVFDQSTDKEHLLGDSEELDRAIEILENEFDDIQHTATSKTRRAGRTLERTFDAEEATKVLRENGLEITAVDSGFAIHIRNPNVNKGKALKKAAELLNCPRSEIVAIGDAQNDIEMLEEAGLSYTPANANPKAKEASTYTTEGIYGEGVKEVIESILIDLEK